MVIAAQVLAENNFGDTRTGGLAGPMGLFMITVLAIATVLLIRNMNARLRRLPDRFPQQRADEGDTADPTGTDVAEPTGVANPADAAESTGSRAAEPTGSGPVDGDGSGPIGAAGAEESGGSAPNAAHQVGNGQSTT